MPVKLQIFPYTCILVDSLVTMELYQLRTLVLVHLSILNVVKVSLMIAGLVFYFLTARNAAQSKLTRDVKISIVLNCIQLVYYISPCLSGQLLE